jgi:hypothetical protein
MRRSNNQWLSIRERCDILARHLLNLTRGTEQMPAAQAICSDPEGIHYGRLLHLLYQAQIPPSRFFAEVLHLWEDPAGQRRPTSRNGSPNAKNACSTVTSKALSKRQN